MLDWLRRLICGEPKHEIKRMTVVRPEAAPSILTLLTSDNVAKYLELSKLAASASLIAVCQQILENQKGNLATLVTNQSKIIAAQLSLARQLMIVGDTIRRFQPGPAVHIQIVEEDMGFTIGVDDSAKRFRLKITDKHGNPAKVDGAPVWAISDPGLLTIAQDDDGMAGAIGGAGPIGVGQLTVTADADLGDGVKTITGTADIEVVAGEASDLAIEPEV